MPKEKNKEEKDKKINKKEKKGGSKKSKEKVDRTITPLGPPLRSPEIAAKHNFHHYHEKPVPKKGKKHPIRTLFKFIFHLIVVIIIIGVTGYFLMGKGYINISQFSNLANKKGKIHIINLDNKEIQVAIKKLDVNNKESQNNVYEIASYETKNLDQITSSRYKLEFTQSSFIRTCTIHINQADKYQFIATTEGIAVTSNDRTSKIPDELKVEKSPLCKK